MTKLERTSHHKIRAVRMFRSASVDPETVELSEREWRLFEKSLEAGRKKTEAARRARKYRCGTHQGSCGSTVHRDTGTGIGWLPEEFPFDDEDAWFAKTSSSLSAYI